MTSWTDFVPRLLILSLFASLVAACTGGPALVGRPGLNIARYSELPPPVREDLSLRATSSYQIGPLDKLTVEVFGLDELRREIQADASGRISFPMAGTIEAAGMTSEELAAAIASRIGGYVRDPQVTVNITETANNLVTVEGEVREPGLYPVVGGMTLVRAVASAKGLTEFARIQEVVVLRTSGGQQYAGLYDLSAIRRGAYADPPIYANDVVIVGDSPSRRLVRNLLQAAPILTAPLIAVLQGR